MATKKTPIEYNTKTPIELTDSPVNADNLIGVPDETPDEIPDETPDDIETITEDTPDGVNIPDDIIEDIPTEETTESDTPVTIEELTDVHELTSEEILNETAVETPTESITEERSEERAEEKVSNVMISNYDLSPLSKLWELETNSHIKSTLLNVINTFKAANGELELAMRLYK